LQDFTHIKAGLGGFSDDPDKHIETLVEVCQVFDLAWKEAMLMLSKTLNASAREAALKQ
jgi:hypothetical protein